MSAAAPLLVIYFLLNMIVFLPLSDGRGRNQHLPVVTLTLIGINLGVHVVMAVIYPAQLGDFTTDLLGLFMALLPAGVMNGMTNGAVTMSHRRFCMPTGCTWLAICSFCCFLAARSKTCWGDPDFCCSISCASLPRALAAWWAR